MQFPIMGWRLGVTYEKVTGLLGSLYTLTVFTSVSHFMRRDPDQHQTTPEPSSCGLIYIGLNERPSRWPPRDESLNCPVFGLHCPIFGLRCPVFGLGIDKAEQIGPNAFALVTLQHVALKVTFCKSFFFSQKFEKVKDLTKLKFGFELVNTCLECSNFFPRICICNF